MDYKEVKKECDALFKELQDKYTSALKDYVSRNGEKRNPFINERSIDVSGWDIGYNGKYNCTLDFIKYDPDKDELRFVILNEDGTSYCEDVITNINTLRYLFYIYCENAYGDAAL